MSPGLGGDACRSISCADHLASNHEIPARGCRAKSRFTCDGETVDVSPGDVLFVAAGLDHRFHDIEDDLDLLVFFSAAKPMTATDDDESEDD